MSRNFNDIYPAIQDVVDDMSEIIANICNTRAERKVLHRRMDNFKADGMDKVELYQAMTKEIEVHNEMEKAHEKGIINHSD